MVHLVSLLAPARGGRLAAGLPHVAEGHVARLVPVDQVLGVVALAALVFIVLSALSGPIYTRLVPVLSVEAHLYSLIVCLIALGVADLADVAVVVDLGAVGHVRLRLDRSGFLRGHVAELLLRREHSLLVLSDLRLVARDVVPVDLAGALVHRRLVQAKLMLLSERNLHSHHLRAAQVPVVVVGDEAVLVGAVGRGVVLVGRLATQAGRRLKPDIVLCIGNKT